MRIASLSPAVTEILFALGKGGLIVVRDQFSTFPDEAKRIPAVKDHTRIDPRHLVPFEPELVFTSTIIQEKLADAIRAAEMHCIHQDPRTVEEIYQSIDAIGMLLECEQDAKALILRMRQEFNTVQKRAALLPRRLRMYIEEWHHPPMASGNWVPEVVKIAGGEQFPLKRGELSREVSLDEVIHWDPDMIVLSICGAGTLSELSLITDRAGWDQLRAVREGNIKIIDDSLLNRPGPRLVEGAQRLYGWMFEMLH